jgi:hypothetical protein
MRADRLASTGLLLLLGSSARSPAQPVTLFASFQYENPDFAAPALQLSIPTPSGAHDWRIGLYGSTLAAALTQRSDLRLSSRFTLELTPWNAHSSRHVYRDGTRAADLEYEDRTVRLEAALVQRHSWRRSTEWKLVGLYESLSDVADPGVRHAWRKPYVGVAVEEMLQRTVSDDVFRSRWDGWKVSAKAEAFSGSRTWWRSSVSAGAGRDWGRVFLSGRLFAFTGDRLDTVSRFLVGGSWELPGVAALPGARYAEFRLDRGVLLEARADVRLFSAWEIGLRAGRLSAVGQRQDGESVAVSTVFRGIGVRAGAGIPRGGSSTRAHGPIFFAGLSAGWIS